MQELIEPIENLVAEVPGSKLRDDFLLDAVEHARDAHLLATRDVVCQLRGQTVQSPAPAALELSPVPLGTHEAHRATVNSQRRRRRLRGLEGKREPQIVKCGEIANFRMEARGNCKVLEITHLQIQLT